jgi:hypothetical protein
MKEFMVGGMTGLGVGEHDDIDRREQVPVRPKTLADDALHAVALRGAWAIALGDGKTETRAANRVRANE